MKRLLLLLTLCACEGSSLKSVPLYRWPLYRCHDVEPGVIWAAAYAAHHVDPTGHGATEAVKLANRAVADWEDHCVVVTEKDVGGRR